MKALLSIIAMTAMLALTPINAPTATAADGGKYELTITIAPGEALIAKGAHKIVVTPKEEPTHGNFDSKEECVQHAMMDIMGNVTSLAQRNLEVGKDYTIDFECSPKGEDI